MTVKKLMNFKIDQDMADQIENTAKIEGKSKTDIMIDSFKNRSQIQELKQQLETKQAELTILQNAYKQATNKPIPRTKRITVSLTPDEYNIITKLAAQFDKPKSHIIHMIITHATKSKLKNNLLELNRITLKDMPVSSQ